VCVCVWGGVVGECTHAPAYCAWLADP